MGSLDWLDELENEVMDEPIPRSHNALPIENPFNMKFSSHAVGNPRERRVKGSERKPSRPWLKFSPPVKRKASPSSQIDKEALPEEMKKLYNDLSSEEDNSQNSGEADAAILKTLFKGSHLESHVSKPGSRRDKDVMSNSLPKDRRRRFRNISFDVNDESNLKRIYSPQNNRIKSEKKNPYDDMIAMMRQTTTNSGN